MPDRLKLLEALHKTINATAERVRMTDRLAKLAQAEPIMDISGEHWVDFGTTGPIAARPLYKGGNAGYETLLTITGSYVVFPSDPAVAYCLPEIDSVLIVIDGMVNVWFVEPDSRRVKHIAGTGQSISIPRGTYVQIEYLDAVVLFKQTPRIAGPQDMVFA